MGRLRSESTAVEPAPQQDKAAAKRISSRAERRRQARERFTSRMCHRCGFGAVKGIPNSHLVHVKDEDGNEAWGHASPTVCAGMVMAITNSARETFKESLSDFLRISRLRAEQYLREWIATFKRFLVEE